MSKKNITARIGIRFNKELEEIKEERLNNRIDRTKKSTKVLTDLITNHKAWPKIKEDTINYDFNKRNGNQEKG